MSEIQITLPDDTIKQVEQGTTSGDIARSIGEGLFRASIAAKVNGDIVDLESPIEKNTNVEILTNKNPEAHEILLHSSAHLLAQAVKELYPKAKIAIGPALSDRYYYDIDVEVSINEEELEKIEQKMKTLAKQNLQVERVELSRNDALEKFKKLGEDYKVEIISEIDENEIISAYQQGNFIDLCRGPHVPSTGKIKHFKLLSSAGAYWRGDEKNKMLTRIYGVAFENKKELDDNIIKYCNQNNLEIALNSYALKKDGEVYNQYKENETVILGSNVIERNGKSSLRWCGIKVEPHEVLSKPYKLEEVQKSFSSLPEHVREIVSPIIQPVLDFHRLLDRKNDLERLDEGWCEFFAYVFAQHKGLPIDMSQIRKNTPVSGIGIDEYVGGGNTTYAQGMYKLADWAQKRGDPIAVLRESLQIRSTQEMDNVIAKSKP